MWLTALILCAVVAMAHVGFLVLEMFLWRRPVGLRIFRKSQAFADETASLAANQGLYNGFLAAGLAWGAILVALDRDPSGVAVFFPLCVVAAGIYGAATVGRKILYAQALPGAIALALVVAVR